MIPIRIRGKVVGDPGDGTVPTANVYDNCSKFPELSVEDAVAI